MHFEVDREDLRHIRIVDDEASVVEPGSARLRVETFALTSNNVTYAVLGDMLRYWSFFPASREGPATWGRIPVWGFTEVVESGTGDLAVGRRVYGYVPMATELVVEPGRVDERGFTDMAAHRQPMAGAYNRYAYTDTDPIYEPGREAHQMVLWPLFFTSFLIDDFVADHDFGASIVVVSSASSKTAIAAAHLLAKRPGLHVVGLTSPRNVTFVGELGCYHDAIAYDDLAHLPQGDALYVDVAGNRDVTARVHEHYGERLLHSMVVGDTHWDHESSVSGPTCGPTPALFFAPDRIARRADEWGRAVLDERVGAAWREYVRWTDGWIAFEQRCGPDAVEDAYRTLLEGRTDPRVGYVCAMTAAS